MNWQELYSFASKQALLGLCFEDIERLGEEYPENLPSIVFTTLSVPLTGDRNPSRNGKDVTALQCYICPTCPSPAGGSLTHSQALALSKRARDVTAPPRRSEPLRSKVGGPKRSSPYFAGWDRLGIAVYSLQLIVYSLRLISWLFADNLQISCDFLGGFEEKAYFCGRSVKYRRN